MLRNAENYITQLPQLEHTRNTFPFEAETLTNFNEGEITPIRWFHVNPGQTLNLRMRSIIRLSPLVMPIMDDLIFKTFAFYVPYRTQWKNWKYWSGEKQNPENPDLEPTYVVPTIDIPAEGPEYNSFYDHTGLTPKIGNHTVNALVPRGDVDIYNKYFRNQALENPLEHNTGDGKDNFAKYSQLRRISKPRDRFTSCLPTMSGTTPVEIPLGTKVPVVSGEPHEFVDRISNKRMTLAKNPNQPFTNTDSLSAVMYVPSKENNIALGGIAMQKSIAGSVKFDNLYADLENATGAPLDALYQAIAFNTTQQLLNRGGSRYFEILSNLYGVVNPSGIIDDPEYLGGGSTNIAIENVVQTSATANQPTGAGNITGFGDLEDDVQICNKSFGEFGFIIIYGVLTHNPKYQQGTNRDWKFKTKEDLFNPLMNFIGDEAVYNYEIMQQPDTVVNAEGKPINNEAFGYNKRFSNYLYTSNEIHGTQRSGHPQTLDANHLAEYFAKEENGKLVPELPKLNKIFDKENAPMERILQVTDEIQTLASCYIYGTNSIEIPTDAIPNITPLRNSFV